MDYLGIFEEELESQGMCDIYFVERQREFNYKSRHFIARNFRLLGIPIWQKNIAEIVSDSLWDGRHILSSPLKIKVIDRKYEKKLERFARNYQNRSNTRVELFREDELVQEDSGFED